MKNRTKIDSCYHVPSKKCNSVLAREKEYKFTNLLFLYFGFGTFMIFGKLSISK